MKAEDIITESLKSKIFELLQKEKESIPLFIPVILGAGILFGVYFPKYACYTLIFMLVAFFLKKTRLYAIIFCLGVYVSQTGGILNTERLTEKKFLENNVEKVIFFADTDFIEETHPTMKNMQRIIFNNIEFDKNMDKIDLNFIKTIKMTCSSKLIKNISPLDRVKVIGCLNKFKTSSFPMSFDQKQFSAITKIDANGVAFFIEKQNTKKKKYDFNGYFSYYRFLLTKLISEKMDSQSHGVASALLTGDKSSIKPEIREKFIKSGTAHILAISGLHMSLVAGILFFILKRILMYTAIVFHKLNPSKTAAFITIPITFSYLALSGFSPSATRAFIMTAVFLFSIIIERKALSLRNVAISAFIILLFNPGSLFHVSFQLSFCAVTAIIAFYEIYQKNLINLCEFSIFNKILSYLIMSVSTTTIATIATTPVSVATFNRFSVQNILGNLVVIPITSFLIVPLGIINLAIGKLTDIFIKPLEYSINFMIKTTGFISELPGSEIALKSPTSISLYCLIIGGIIICILKTKLKFIGVIPILLSVIHYTFIQKNPDIIFVPGEDNVICIVKDGKLFATSKQKGRNKILSIQKTLGLSGKIEKIQKPIYLKITPKSKEQGLFIWMNNKNQNIIKMKQLRNNEHPYCPARFEKPDL